MLYFVSPNFLIVSVPISVNGGNANTYTNWGPQQQLVNCKVVAIETYCALDTTADQNNPGNTVISASVMTKAAVTLYRNDPVTNKPGLWYQYVPLTRLRLMNNNDTTQTPLASFVRDPFVIPPSILTYEKCQLNFPTSPPLAVAANTSALFGISYLSPGEDSGGWYEVVDHGHAKK